MDISYNQHAERQRRKNRSSTSLNHLSLAPLTVKLPLNDADIIPASLVPPHTAPPQQTSYLQGKSAPTTPRLLSRSPAGTRSRSHHRTPSTPGTHITKSMSSSHLVNEDRRRSMPGLASSHRKKNGEQLGPTDRIDSDWMLRAGALMSSEAREYKGQAWLVSRQSSTSLAGMRDAEEEAFEAELAREREIAASRRGSSADDDASTHCSKYPSRSNSVPAITRSYMATPHERPDMEDDSSYFPNQDPLSGADFVNLDAKLEELERGDTLQDDEATVRRLVRRGQNGHGSWMSNVVGWSLFSVDENEEDSEDGEEESVEELTPAEHSTTSSRRFEGVTIVPEERMPPPNREDSGWNDAAWLLSVASKVMF